MSYLRRYTNVPALIEILLHKGLTLLSPSTWTDSNDVYAIEQYKNHNTKNIKKLLALCFTEAEETFHHWNVFASDPSGVCIVFDKEALIESAEKRDGVRHGPMTYLNKLDFEFTNTDIDKLPFIKRNGYNDEKEYRFIYESTDEDDCLAGIQIDTSCIKEIIFSPKIPYTLFLAVTSVISQIDALNYQKIPMHRSELVNDIEWKIQIDLIAQPGTNPKDHFIKHVF